MKAETKASVIFIVVGFILCALSLWLPFFIHYKYVIPFVFNFPTVITSMADFICGAIMFLIGVDEIR